jgi:hypothetical protein
LAFVAFGIGLSRLSPIAFGYWVAQWMDFDREAFGGTHLWPVHAAGAGILDSVVPAVGLVACGLAPFVASWVLRRSDV